MAQDGLGAEEGAVQVHVDDPAPLLLGAVQQGLAADDAGIVEQDVDVAETLENSYPVYTTFVTMPGMSDTVDVVVVTTIVDELNADAHNMRHIYPYNYLVAQGVLPAGLDHGQQRSFYKCFANKVNSTYSTMTQFFNAVLADTTDTSRIRRIESQCANDLFNWTVTEVDVIETVD